MKRFLVCLVATLLLISLTVPTLAAGVEGFTNMQVTSTSIKDGKLLTITAANNKYNAPKGKNKSPQLEWAKVEGAKFYAVVMIDKSTGANTPWLHWLKKDIKATAKGETQELKQGKFTGKSVYVGPYPPLGAAHNYEIYVFALKAKPKAFKAKMNSNTTSFDDIVKGLNTAKNITDNILAVGSIGGTYAHGDDTK